jgi:hypothetical protein
VGLAEHEAVFLVPLAPQLGVLVRRESSLGAGGEQPSRRAKSALIRPLAILVRASSSISSRAARSG